MNADDARTAAAAPLRAWLANGCRERDPVPGLSSALALGDHAPFFLARDELEYFSELFGDRTPFLVPARPKAARSRTATRDGLLARGIVVPDPSKRGPYAVELAPEYFASIGVAFLAARSTTFRVATQDRQDHSVVVRSGSHVVMLDDANEDQVRLRVLSPEEVLRELVGAIPFDFSGERGRTTDASDDDGDQPSRAEPKAPNWSSTSVSDSFATAPAWITSSTHVNLTIDGEATWLSDPTAALDQVRRQRIGAEQANAIIASYCSDPGPAAEAQASKEADAARAQAKIWRHRSPWRQTIRALVAAFHAVDWVITLVRTPVRFYRTRLRTPPAELPPPPPVRGLTPDG